GNGRGAPRQLEWQRHRASEIAKSAIAREMLGGWSECQGLFWTHKKRHAGRLPSNERLHHQFIATRFAAGLLQRALQIMFSLDQEQGQRSCAVTWFADYGKLE